MAGVLSQCLRIFLTFQNGSLRCLLAMQSVVYLHDSVFFLLCDWGMT
jgi:hypothetical protein